MTVRALNQLMRLAMVALLFTGGAAPAANVPNALLEIPIPLISGEETSLAEYRGEKPVYLKFWATWCQPCRKEMPHFEHVQKDYGDAVKVIGVNLAVNDDLSDVEQTIEEFGLTMPMAMDHNGDLVKAFRMVGTPYHLLFDQDMNLVHRGHKANEMLDKKLAQLANAKIVDLLGSEVLEERENTISLTLDDGRVHALYFTATWCDTYLKGSRPEDAEACKAGQEAANALHEAYPTIQWHGLLSRLWTDDSAMAGYRNKYGIEYPLAIDTNNHWFHRFEVKDLPTLILVRDGDVLYRTEQPAASDELQDVLKRQEGPMARQ